MGEGEGVEKGEEEGDEEEEMGKKTRKEEN